MSAVVYSITNLFNGKRYIGSSRRYKKRMSYHKSLLRAGKHSCHLQAAFNKYGEQAFDFNEIIETLSDSDSEKLLDREEYWISAFKVTNPAYGYNTYSDTHSIPNHFGRKLNEHHLENVKKGLIAAWNKPGMREKASERTKKLWDCGVYDLMVQINGIDAVCKWSALLHQYNWLLESYNGANNKCDFICSAGHRLTAYIHTIGRDLTNDLLACKTCYKDFVANGEAKKAFVAEAESRGWKIMSYKAIRQLVNSTCPKGHICNVLPSNLRRSWKNGSIGCKQCKREQ